MSGLDPHHFRSSLCGQAHQPPTDPAYEPATILLTSPHEPHRPISARALRNPRGPAYQGMDIHGPCDYRSWKPRDGPHRPRPSCHDITTQVLTGLHGTDPEPLMATSTLDAHRPPFACKRPALLSNVPPAALTRALHHTHPHLTPRAHTDVTTPPATGHHRTSRPPPPINPPRTGHVVSGPSRLHST